MPICQLLGKNVAKKDDTSLLEDVIFLAYIEIS